MAGGGGGLGGGRNLGSIRQPGFLLEALDKSQSKRDGGFKNNWSFDHSEESEGDTEKDEANLLTFDESDGTCSPNGERKPYHHRLVGFGARNDALRTYSRRNKSDTPGTFKSTPTGLNISGSSKKICVNAENISYSESEVQARHLPAHTQPRVKTAAQNKPFKTMDPKNIRKRKYSEDFLQYGFTSICTAGIEKPQCVLCSEVLSTESMKPNKLKRHFETRHPSYAGKDINYFRSKADVLKKGRLDTGGKYQKQNVAALEGSYLVALRIARAMKPHTIADELLLPAAKDLVRVMIGEEFVTKLNAVSLSNDTVRRRIDDMSADILDQVIQEIKSAPLPVFSIQIDESTDVANCSQLLVYVRYVNDGDFKDGFLFCKPLETTTTARDVFDKVGSFLNEHNISWEKVCGVCTDGAQLC